MADESDAVAAWIFGYLSGDSALTAVVGQRIYDGTAPDPTAFPYVRFEIVPGADLVVSGLTRVLATANLRVRGVGKQAPYSSLVTIANRIDALLDKRSEWLAGQTLRITCQRIRPIRYEEPPVEGVIFRHLGGEYSCLLQPNAGS